MKKTIKVNLNSKSIKEAIKDLDAYEQSIRDKSRRAIDMLIDKGIVVARNRISGEYAGYISFQKEFKDELTGVTGTLVCTDTKIMRQWKTGGYLVSPMLLQEFGSGWLASNPENFPGVGQGTMPGQKHAFDTNGWWWEDENGNKHHSYGENPTHFLHNAYLQMVNDVYQVFREVFNE